MFIKAFKVKSNNQLKGTERKKLCEEVAAAFPSLSEDDIQTLLPKKEAISSMKIMTHSGQLGKLYCVAKVPMFFQLEQTAPGLLPTVYTLWHHPHLLSSFTTVQPVVPKLAGGANLMLPGVVLDGPPTLWSYGKLPKGTPVSVNTEQNKAPVAVGLTALSSEDMYMSAGHGKCVEILHVMGDQLCQLGKPVARPELGAPGSENISESLESVEQPEKKAARLGESLETLETGIANIEVGNEISSEPTDPSSEENCNKNEMAETPATLESDPVKEMDTLLEYCFLKACKVMKKTDLPVLSSNFFKNHLIPACPEGQTVDIKKSSYKKLSAFLLSMKTKGVINTEVLKGVESILSIKVEHPLLRELVVLEASVPVQPAPSNAPVVAECYKVTADVLPILSKFRYDKKYHKFPVEGSHDATYQEERESGEFLPRNMVKHVIYTVEILIVLVMLVRWRLSLLNSRKGDVMRRPEIRKCFTDYVKRENLQEGKILKLDPLLAGILRTKESQVTLTMEDGINKFIGRMTHVHEITFGETRILHTGKLDPIDITVATRASNKKVTLINNLESFGIKLDAFSKECQGIGASATITDIPGKKTPSVQVQGNQVLYVYKLLTEKYQINKNYIRGLEFAPKKRK